MTNRVLIWFRKANLMFIRDSAVHQLYDAVRPLSQVAT